MSRKLAKTRPCQTLNRFIELDLGSWAAGLEVHSGLPIPDCSTSGDL